MPSSRQYFQSLTLKLSQLKIGQGTQNIFKTMKHHTCTLNLFLNIKLKAEEYVEIHINNAVHRCKVI